MKYLKEYNEWSQIEELSDCLQAAIYIKPDVMNESLQDVEDLEDYLQEIMDKYNIVSKTRQKSPSGVRAYDRDDEQIYYRLTCSGTFCNDGIVFTNVNKKVGDKIIKDLISIKSNLEKRMNRKINIELTKVTYGEYYYIKVECD